MTSFRYIARTRTGERMEGAVEAGDRRTALAQIERMGLVPVSVSEVRAAAAAGAKPRRRFAFESRRTPRMRMKDVLLFSTELGDLLAAGMTLGNALNVLVNSKTGRATDAIVQALRDDIVQGSSLSNALAKHPRSFSPLYVNMIRAGEASGTLTQVLKRLVEHYEMMTEVRDKVITAMVYPAIVMALGVVTVVVSVWYVIPKFAPIFEEMRGTLPLSTRMLIGFSKWMAAYGWIAILALGVMGIFAHRAVKTEKGRFWWHGFLLRVPFLNSVISAGIYAGFSRTLGTLLSNGVPVLRALAIVEQTVNNAVIANEIRKARDRVTDGTTISGPLAAGGVFPRAMTDMLAIGEQTGNVPNALSHVAVRYEHQLDRNVRVFTTALEPILILVMAVVVGFVAMSILSAVFSMTKGLDAPT